jgi:uncharacterized protein (DUF4415 family)
MTEKKDFEPGRGTKDDWEAMDSPELAGEQLTQAKPFGEAFPDLAARIKRGRGRPPVENPKEHVSLRLSREVLQHYRSTGPGWQGRIDADLRKVAGIK